MKIAAFVERHRAAVYLATALLTAAGLYALFTLPAGIYPEVTYPRVAVIARGGTFEAQEMTVAFTRPLEEAMSGVIDLQRIRARTVRGATELNLDFRPAADMQFALSQVQGRLASLQPQLPPGLELTAERLTPSVFPILQYQVTGADPFVLRDLADFTIRPRLAGLPDVGMVEVQGGLVREISVELSPQRLVANRTSVSEVAQAIQHSNLAVAAGRVDRQYRQYAIIVSGLATTPAAIGQVVVQQVGNRAVRVADLGTVRYGAQDQFQIVSGNGRPAALVNISRQPNGNALQLQAAVQQAIDSIRPLLPAGVRLEVVYDQAALVRESIAGVRDAMLIGGALAILVLLLFLGRWRTTLAAALTLPLTLSATLLGLLLFRDSLNLMSLGGLAVAIGLVIDDAVVVVENIERRLALHPGEASAEVIRSGTDEILGPVASSTLTTVVVFAPLGLLQGVVGEFFRSFALALAVAVLLSLVFAVTLIPALVGHWVGRGGGLGPAPGGSPRRRLPTLSLAGLERGHGRALRWTLDHRHVALAAAGGLLVASLSLSRGMATGFLPEMDEGGFILDYWTPTGSSLAETDRQMKILEGILGDDPDVQAFTRRTGAELGFAATAPNTGDFTVLLKPRSERRASIYRVIDRVRSQAQARAPAVRVEFIQLLQDVIGDLAGAPAPVELKLFGADRQATERAARSIAQAVEGTPGLVDLFDGVQGDNPELRLDLDPTRLARLGLTAADVAGQARAALFGADAGSARERDRLVPIRVRLPDSVRFSADVAAILPIIAPAGWVPLGAAGTVRDTADASELLRENLRPVVAVTAQVDGGKLGAVMREVRSRVSLVPLPAGVTLELGGQYASQQQSFRQLLGVLALAAGAVLMVLVAQFNGLRGPLAIVLAVPLGLTGALAVLAATGVPFNVSSFMGAILLVGLTVKNGILLFDAARVQHAAGAPLREGLLAAGRLRLRPILMTTLCTVAGLIPLALGWGAGAELQRPLALAVIGGLTVSTVGTLLLLPVALDWLGAIAHSGTGRHERGPAEL